MAAHPYPRHGAVNLTSTSDVRHGLGCHRDREGKGAAAARRGLGPDAPAMALDDPPARRQADAAALVIAAAASEHLEDRAVRRQADAVVADGERPAGVVAACRDTD